MSVERKPPPAARATRLVLEHGTTSDPDRDEYETSQLKKLIERMGGRGSAKIYRLVQGKHKYVDSWSADDTLIENFEERMAELGGGDYIVKFVHAHQHMGSMTFAVDEVSHPPAGQKVAGAAVDVGSIVRDVVQQIAPLMRPADNGLSDVLKLMLHAKDEHSDRMFQLAMRAQTPSPAPATAPAALDLPTQIRNLSSTVKAIDDIRGSGPAAAAAGDPKFEQRSLALRIVEKPLEKGAEKIADRIIDRYFPGGAEAATQPQQQTRGGGGAEQVKPGDLPKRTADTPVKMPGGVKPLSNDDVARMKRGGPRQAAPPSTPAPRAKEAAPEAVATKK